MDPNHRCQRRRKIPFPPKAPTPAVFPAPLPAAESLATLRSSVLRPGPNIALCKEGPLSEQLRLTLLPGRAAGTALYPAQPATPIAPLTTKCGSLTLLWTA